MENKKIIFKKKKKTFQARVSVIIVLFAALRRFCPELYLPAEIDALEFFSGCNTGLSLRRLTESKGE